MPSPLGCTLIPAGTLGLAVFTQLHANSPVTGIVGNLVLLGFGFALFSSPNMSAIMGAVATMRLLGQMVSMAIATAVLALFVGNQAITPDSYARFLTGTRVVFAVSVGLCTVWIFFSMFRGWLRKQ